MNPMVVKLEKEVSMLKKEITSLKGQLEQQQQLSISDSEYQNETIKESFELTLEKIDQQDLRENMELKRSNTQNAEEIERLRE